MSTEWTINVMKEKAYQRVNAALFERKFTVSLVGAMPAVAGVGPCVIS